MIRARCPICGRAADLAAIDDWPSFPFCTERCRLVDLGRWLDGRYVVPGPPAPSTSGGADAGTEAADNEDLGDD